MGKKRLDQVFECDLCGVEGTITVEGKRREGDGQILSGTDPIPQGWWRIRHWFFKEVLLCSDGCATGWVADTILEMGKD